jgi:hypothetical protein
VVRCRSLAEETSPGSCRGEALRAALAAEDSAAAASLYVLLRAADRFHATYQRYPGCFDRWGHRAGGGGARVGRGGMRLAVGAVGLRTLLRD